MTAFKRTTEDFVCAQCGQAVTGTGYTNHCPHCFWSKHVDVEPGDRAAECGGLMEPIDVYLEHQSWFVVQRCQLCGETRRNKVDSADEVDALIELNRQIVERKMKK